MPLDLAIEKEESLYTFLLPSAFYILQGEGEAYLHPKNKNRVHSNNQDGSAKRRHIFKNNC
jgi:hypothetical protein